eukprot:GHVQ01028626.1.p1 GENE.GHVQ01028626.1~~GHVQ01028626.1.p1  ORF type:complete len:571 (+),score=101.51 GHVQ01028626.1:232-1944(+)
MTTPPPPDLRIFHTLTYEQTNNQTSVACLSPHKKYTKDYDNISTLSSYPPLVINSSLICMHSNLFVFLSYAHVYYYRYSMLLLSYLIVSVALYSTSAHSVVTLDRPSSLCPYIHRFHWKQLYPSSLFYHTYVRHQLLYQPSFSQTPLQYGGNVQTQTSSSSSLQQLHTSFEQRRHHREQLPSFLVCKHSVACLLLAALESPSCQSRPKDTMPGLCSSGVQQQTYAKQEPHSSLIDALSFCKQHKISSATVTKDRRVPIDFRMFSSATDEEGNRTGRFISSVCDGHISNPDLTELHGEEASSLFVGDFGYRVPPPTRFRFCTTSPDSSLSLCRMVSQCRIPSRMTCCACRSSTASCTFGYHLSSSSSGARIRPSVTRLHYRYPSIEPPKYKKYRFTRRYKTGTLTRQTGSTHLHELTRERRLLSEKTTTPITQGAHMLYVAGVDRRISDADLESFLGHFLGGPDKVVCRLARDTTKGLGHHRGHGILFFESPFLATTCLLKYNGVLLGDKNIVLGEAFRRDYLMRKRGVGAVMRTAVEIVQRRSLMKDRGMWINEGGGGEWKHDDLVGVDV